ncbi:MAG: methyltransferase domain-containing protein [Acidobacteria bacterium]|nr:methyltransferase domain-containing protein [Acidobacteriota bacterium]
MNAATTSTSELASLKAKLKTTWMAGDFDKIAQVIAAGGEDFIARLQINPGTRVLDVACGTGNLSVPAAKAGAIVTGVDIAPNLLATARRRAQAKGVVIQFDEGDAEALPYADAGFDEVVTMFGAMFAPQPGLVAAELARVCRSGGRLAMANWTPTGFVGQMFKVTGKHVPPPPMSSPLLWGDEATLRERLGATFSNIQLTSLPIVFDFPFAAPEVVEFWRVYYGPTNRAFEALKDDPAKQAALRKDLEQLWSEHNQTTDGTTRVETEYLAIVATRN